MRGAVLLLIMAAADCAAQSLADFAGTWVLKFQGRNLMVLTLKLDGDRMTGTMVRPESFSTDSDGYFEKISASHATDPVEKCVLADGRLRLVIDDSRYTITLAAAGHAAIELVLDDPRLVMAPWIFDRSPDPDVTASSDWPTQHYSSPIVRVQQRLDAMAREDQAFRAIGSLAYDPRSEAADRKHRPQLLRIYKKYGWPAWSMVGKKAGDQFWLLVQHQDLLLQQQMFAAMEQAVKAGEASIRNFALLYDNILVSEGKLQRWGNKVQSACQDGKPPIFPVEDPAGLNQRRKEIGLMPIEAYLKMFEPSCVKPGQRP